MSGNFTDFVEEERAFVGQFEDAALFGRGVGKSALFVAEQLALQQGFPEWRRS
jgi:hypothetical protein